MDSGRNKLASKLIKAEMLGDLEAVAKFQAQFKDLIAESSDDHSRHLQTGEQSRPQIHRERPSKAMREFANPLDGKVKKFLASTSSLGQMFAQEKSLSASDEARMFAKTAAKFARDSMDTNNFSEELDDSQLILNKSKKHKQQEADYASALESPATQKPNDKDAEQKTCDGCSERQAKHLIIDKTFKHVYVTLNDMRPFLSTMSNVTIRNNDHSCDSFVSASEEHQADAEKAIDLLKVSWKSRGYRCIVMETYFKNRRPSNREFTSCGKHFQLHCLPIKEKHFEKAKMCFKQALQECGREWAMNKTLIQTDERRIQRYIPRGLSYFWVCFDSLKKGFGHVIEMEKDFYRYFGLEILSGSLGKDFNPIMISESEEFNEQFKRSRDFKLLYSKFKR